MTRFGVSEWTHFAEDDVASHPARSPQKGPARDDIGS